MNQSSSIEKGKVLMAFMLISMLFSILSCNQSNHQKEYVNERNQLVIQEWYSLDNLKSETIYLKDDKSDYIYVSYNQNGRISDSGRYVNDTITGFHKFYEEKTKLMHSEYYKNGLLNGIHKAIYTGGISSFEGFRKDGFPVGEWKFHYPDGQMITYEYYDSVGRIKYFRKYDDKGNVLKINGNGIINIFTSGFFADSISGIVEVAQPPNCWINLKVSKKDHTGELTIFEKEVLKSRIPFAFWQGNRENFEILCYLSITEKETSKEETYSLEKKY